ncbi:MAG: 50S ribosomal protein L10 [Bacteroidales bacterium]|nr:50S ribosomal protein L10 [Bacteroidales bacterium]
MKREDKDKIISNLTETINHSKHFYLTDTSELNAETTSQLRRKCFEQDIKLIVVKNTLLRKALEKCSENFEELYGVLKNSTSIMFSEKGNVPAKLIKEFRKTFDRPLLKAAYVEESFYIGDDQLDALASIKTKEEIIGEVIIILQSPVRNILSGLQSGKHKLAGIIKTLSEKEKN